LLIDTLSQLLGRSIWKFCPESDKLRSRTSRNCYRFHKIKRVIIFVRMTTEKINLLLADDDVDDCDFFRDALDDYPVTTTLTIVHNGVELMKLLTQKGYKLPHALYLDLNMPRKSGFECLSEIKLNQTLKQLPVIIFSTSFDREIVKLLHQRVQIITFASLLNFQILKR
jgi:CheY-like chemotaxis protein